MSVPAGWYPDATGTLRWWDGAQWAPAPAPVNYATPGQGRVAQGTPANTVWAWLIVLLPLASVIPTFGYLAYFQQSMLGMLQLIPLDGSEVDPQAMLAFQLNLIFNPWYFALMLVGCVIYGLSVWFAYLDSRELKRRGFIAPFHWAWTFLSALVYIIGRTVVVRRRGGRSAGPLIVLIVTQVLLVIAIFVWVGVATSEFMNAVSRMVGGTV